MQGGGKLNTILLIDIQTKTTRIELNKQTEMELSCTITAPALKMAKGQTGLL